MLNPIWLNTFKTLIDVGHFTKTAEVLNMTQPGVSQHISKLEMACGYPLIRRFNKQFELTLHGKKVYQYAQKMQQDELALFTDLGIDEPCKGRCTIGCSGTLAWFLYPELISLQIQCPDLSIEVEATPNEKIFEQVMNGTIDIGLATKPPSEKHFNSRVIGKELLAFVVPSAADTSLPLNELLVNLGVIRHPDLEHYFRSYVTKTKDPEFAKLELDVIKTKSYINQVHQILMPVAKGIGFTVVPMCCIAMFAEKEKIQILGVKDDICEPIYLITKRHSPLAKRYDRVIETIENSICLN